MCGMKSASRRGNAVWQEAVLLAPRLLIWHLSEACRPCLQLLVEDMSALMRAVALHNAPLLHQHSCRRMDSGAVAVRDQVPPPGFYKSILVRRHRRFCRSLCVRVSARGWLGW